MDTEVWAGIQGVCPDLSLEFGGRSGAWEGYVEGGLT